MPGSFFSASKCADEMSCDHVDLALLERLHERLVVGEDPQHQLVDLRRAGPVGLVGGEPVELAGPRLGQLERPAADRRLVVGERRDRLAVDVLPDVLGKDRHLHPQHAGAGLRGLEDDGVVVGGGDLRDQRDVAAVLPVLGLAVDGPLERVGDVLGREVLPVGPLDALADVERPRLAVRRVLPPLGEPGLRREVLGGVEREGVVHELVGLERRGDHADVRVERVDVLLDAEHERRAGARRRLRRARARAAGRGGRLLGARRPGREDDRAERRRRERGDGREPSAH